MKIETTKTDVTLATIQQRLQMLPTPPAAPVRGRGAVRHCLSGDSQIVDYMVNRCGDHFACISVREPINRFGRLGTPKYLFCSPEMFALFA